MTKQNADEKNTGEGFPGNGHLKSGGEGACGERKSDAMSGRLTKDTLPHFTVWLEA